MNAAVMGPVKPGGGAGPLMGEVGRAGRVQCTTRSRPTAHCAGYPRAARAANPDRGPAGWLDATAWMPLRPQPATSSPRHGCLRHPPSRRLDRHRSQCRRRCTRSSRPGGLAHRPAGGGVQGCAARATPVVPHPRRRVRCGHANGQAARPRSRRRRPRNARDNPTIALTCADPIGPPPRVRRRRPRSRRTSPSFRTSPARAGTTIRNRTQKRTGTDQPRACGDDRGSTTWPRPAAGPAPRVRGRHCEDRGPLPGARTSPARAGTTLIDLR
jgi:hypothetical protein